MRLALLALVLAAGAQAQTPLAPGAARSGTLDRGGADAYALTLDAETFVAGVVRQRDADFVVTVTGPDGSEVGAFDQTARGAEPFQFVARAAGRYTVTVEPFEDAAGAYEVEVDRVEPVATTPAGRVGQMLADRDHAGAPGALVAVLDGGEVVYQTATGTANLTHGVPMTLGTKTNIGSTSKQFTAFALVLLDDRGALSLDDDVREYVPELPDFGETVTLRHLLTHTSGYREVYNSLLVAGRPVLTGDPVERAEIVGTVVRQPALQNAPGAEWSYNNTGYGLAALVVERVAGRPFPEWMAENVFGPLGMDDTVVRASPGAVVANSAQGYVPGPDGWVEARDLGASMGAGGIYTTVGDLAKWLRHYESPTLVSPDVLAQMTTAYTLTTGEATDYGFGLILDEYGGRRRVSHGGADTAHRSEVMFFPEIGVGVVVQTNSPADVSALAVRVADAFFADRFETDAAPDDAASGPTAVAFDDALFDDYVGRYALDVAPAFVLTFRRDGDGGYLTQATGQGELEIVPTSDSTFALTAVEAAITFHRDRDGVVRSATMHQGGDNRATRLDVEPLAEAPAVDLAAYAGRYFSATSSRRSTRSPSRTASSSRGRAASRSRCRSGRPGPTRSCSGRA